MRLLCFPWPSRRDARTHDASLPGADLVGFSRDIGGDCFAFGEVKTSSERRYPPRVMYGTSGLKKQIRNLRDRETCRNDLFKYLCARASMTSWQSRLKAAGRRYLKNSSDVQLYGVLIRDVEPRIVDMERSVDDLAGDCSEGAKIEFLAVYLPEDGIGSAADAAVRKRETL